MTKAESLRLENRLARSNTNNVLHLILSVLTVGIWIPVWMIVALNNSVERKRIINKLTDE